MWVVNDYRRNGAASNRAGSVTTAQTSCKAPSTAIPTIRNGSRNSHTIGYITNANSASGQQTTNKMHHNKNATMIPLCFKIRRILTYSS